MRLFIFIAFISATLQAVDWMSYKEALELQKKTHKPIMLDVMRSDCHYCIDMEQKVFKDVTMTKWLQERFIPVKINLDKDEMPIDQEVVFTPTFFFLDGHGTIIKKIPGSWNIQDFKDLTRKIR